MSGKKKQYSNEKLKEAVEEVKAGACLRATAKNMEFPTPLCRTVNALGMTPNSRRFHASIGGG